jgi:hypothetical protein
MTINEGTLDAARTALTAALAHVSDEDRDDLVSVANLERLIDPDTGEPDVARIDAYASRYAPDSAGRAGRAPGAGRPNLGAGFRMRPPTSDGDGAAEARRRFGNPKDEDTATSTGGHHRSAEAARRFTKR